jgi:hypothetical protein
LEHKNIKNIEQNIFIPINPLKTFVSGSQSSKKPKSLENANFSKTITPERIPVRFDYKGAGGGI